MFLFFLDGSGGTQIPHRGATDLYVLGGLAIPDYSWTDVATHLKTVKDYFGVAVYPEIKWRHIHQPYDANRAPDDRYPLSNVPITRRTRIANAVLEIVKKRPQLVVFATVVDKKKLLRNKLRRYLVGQTTTIIDGFMQALVAQTFRGNDQTKRTQMATWLASQALTQMSAASAAALSTELVNDFDHNVFELAFTDVVDNLEGFLAHAPALPDRWGIVVQDEESSTSTNQFARACFQRRAAQDQRPITERPLLECLSLVPSHHSVGVQIADFCMGALNWSVTRNDTSFSSVIEDNINKTRRNNRLIGLHTLP